jgi:hypothetical protein
MGGRGPWKSLPLPPPPRPPPRRPAAAAAVAAPPLLATAAAVSLCLHCLLTRLQLIPRGRLTVAVATAAGVASCRRRRRRRRCRRRRRQRRRRCRFQGGFICLGRFHRRKHCVFVFWRGGPGGSKRAGGGTLNENSTSLRPTAKRSRARHEHAQLSH